MAYTFEQLLAADPSNPSNIAQNGSITIFAPGDPTMTPLTITDPDGSPLPNPFTVNANGFGPAFAHATLDRVAWSGGGFTGFVTSYEGMKDEAIAAREAAESAAAEAGAQAVVRLDELIAAGSFEGPAGPLTNLTVGTVEATPGNPLTDDIVASEVLNGTATTAALNATYLPGDATGATDGQVAAWDAASGKFKPKPGGTGDVAKSTTGYTGSPAFVQDATLSPTDVDGRTLVVPARDKPLTQDSTVTFGERRNKWQYTEDVASNRYGTGNMTKTTDTITVDGITLTRVTSANYYGSLNTNLGGLGISPFTVGNRYLLSYYAVSRRDVEQFVWMRDRGYNAGAGHGQKLLQPNKLTRLWNLVQATATNGVADQGTPSNGWTGSSVGPTWLMQGNADGGALDVYVGGFQIEDMGTTAVDGIAAIGDSTIQGASGSNDSGTARETMGYLAGLLNATTYNRGIGGNTTANMDARWATDITPLKPLCKYVIIQGGINDIVQGRTLADIKASITSMNTKAGTDGFIPVFLTCTPTSSIAANATYEQMRLDLNAWIKQTFPRVIDIAPVVADPFDGKYLRRTPGGSAGWYGDGVHYTQKAKRAIAERIAAWHGWELPTPSPYQKIAAATWAPYGGVVLVSPNGTKYKLTVADGGALSAVAV